MRKIVILFIFSAMICRLSAQITITDDDFPSANSIFSINTASDIQGIDPSLTGVNFSWDFSILDIANQRIDTFVSVSSTPIIYQFFFNNALFYPNHKAILLLKVLILGFLRYP